MLTAPIHWRRSHIYAYTRVPPLQLEYFLERFQKFRCQRRAAGHTTRLSIPAPYEADLFETLQIKQRNDYLINHFIPSSTTMSGGGSGDATLFEEGFTVTGYNQEKYDRVARIMCTSIDSQTLLELDINIELFPCNEGDTLHVVLTTTLSPDGSKEDDKGWRDVGKSGDAPATLADLYDYVCYGKIYKFEETFDGNTMYVDPPITSGGISCVG